MADKQRILVGKISGLFGVKGWLKVFSYTDPRENIINYSPWMLVKDTETKEVTVVEGKRQGKNVIVSLENFVDREIAATLFGWDIYINYSQLPKINADEYYWTDLVGLKVETVQGVYLGVVDYLLATGANDVLVIAGDRERLIPYIQGQTIKKIDLAKGFMVVDWDADF